MSGFSRVWTPSAAKRTNGVEKNSLPEPAEAAGPNYMPLNLYFPGLTKVHNNPPIYTVDNFLSDSEVDAFTEVAAPLLQRSKTHAIAGTLPILQCATV